MTGTDPVAMTRSWYPISRSSTWTVPGAVTRPVPRISVMPDLASSPAAPVSSRWRDSSSRRRTAWPKAAASGPRDGAGAAPPPRRARFRACCRACALVSMALLGMQAT